MEVRPWHSPPGNLQSMKISHFCGGPIYGHFINISTGVG